MILGTFIIFFVMVLVVFGYILAISFVMWMAIDAGKQDKFWWMVLVFALPVIGAIVYYFTEKKHEYVKMPKESCEHCAEHTHK